MAMTFTPVRQARASGEIVSQIERAIFSGELKSGDRLESERELAERLLDRFSDAVLAAAAPGETLRLAVRREEGYCALRLSRPRALEGLSDSAMFGGGEGERADFSLRMVVGLAAIVGGKLVADGSDLVLRMPMAR